MQTFCVPGRQQPFGLEIVGSNFSETSVNLSWQFSSNNTNSFLIVDPPDILTQTLVNGERSVDLENLVPGTSYNVLIFPFIGQDLETSPSVGDPLSVLFETKLEKPILYLPNTLDTNSASGSATITGRFRRAEISLNGFEDIKQIEAGTEENVVWFFDNLASASKYSVILTLFSERDSVSSDVVDFITKPKSVRVLTQNVKSNKSVDIILELGEPGSPIELFVSCNNQEPVGLGISEYSPIYNYPSPAQHFGCTLQVRSISQSVGSSWLTVGIGIAIVKNIFISKNKDSFEFIWELESGGEWSFLYLEYEDPVDGLQVALEILCSSLSKVASAKIHLEIVVSTVKSRKI